MKLFGGGSPVDWLIVGLGNPGRQYSHTRHNAGFMVAEELVSRWQLGRPRQRFRAQLYEGRIPPHLASGAGVDAFAEGVPRTHARGRAAPRVGIVCPQTYMNEAGRSVGPARGTFKLALDRLLVVHDEIDLPFGEIRSRVGGGLAGHNGLKSLKRELGSGDFMRVRVGVGRPSSTDPEIVSAYVLGRFAEPSEQVEELIGRAADEVQRIVLGQ